MYSSGSTVPFAVESESLSPVQESTGSVGSALGIEGVLVFLTLSVVIVGVLGILTYLYSARKTVNEEIQEVEAERRAFLSFADHIQALPEQTEVPARSHKPVQMIQRERPPIYDVVSSFEKTVMQLSHYETAYGEETIDQLSMELGPELVLSLQQQQTLSPTLKTSITEQAVDAAEKRTTLLTVLEDERDSLQQSRTRLSEVVSDLDEMNREALSEKPFDHLAKDSGELRNLHRDVESEMQTRQQVIHRLHHQFHFSEEDHLIQEYLYQDGERTFPVLSATTTLDRLIREARSRVISAFTRSV